MKELTTQNEASGMNELRRLSTTEAELPLEVAWLANIRNLNTGRAYKRDVKDFSLFIGIKQVKE